MANTYRVSRNVEASIIQFIDDELTNAGWSNIRVEKSFARVEKDTIPAVVVRTGNTTHTRAEIGGTSTFRQPLVFIDIFAKSDGQRLDLKDFLISVLKHGVPLFEYTINNGQIQSKTQIGRLQVIDILDTEVNLGFDKDDLDVIDRFRHLLTLTVETGKLEV